MSTPVDLKHLGSYLDRLPPVIARKRVEQVLGGIVSRKTLSNDDSKGRGPRVRLVQQTGGRQEISYDTASLLEYLEQEKGVRVLIRPEV